MVEGEDVLNADLGEEALILFVVSGDVCNHAGVAKMDALRAAMSDPEVLQAALRISE